MNDSSDSVLNDQSEAFSYSVTGGDWEWFATKKGADVFVYKRLKSPNGYLFEEWQNAEVSEAPSVVRAAISVWEWTDDDYSLSTCLECGWRGDGVQWHWVVTGHEEYRDDSYSHFVSEEKST